MPDRAEASGQIKLAKGLWLALQEWGGFIFQIELHSQCFDSANNPGPL